MNELIINDVIIIAATAVTTIGGLLAVVRPFLFKIGTFPEQNAATIVKDTKEAAGAAKAATETPISASVKHHLETEVNKVIEKFKQSEMTRLALVGLHGFGLKLDNLSDTQKAALVKFVAESVPAEWNVKQADVTAVLDDVQKAADAFSQLVIVKAANFFTSAQKNGLIR
jgi:hypothetical protein